MMEDFSKYNGEGSALRAAQLKMLEILSEIDRVCKKNGLVYWIDFGTLLGAEITRRCPTGLPDDTITVNCTGSGGQSFGAFIPKGLTLDLTGDSNDYFG